MGLAERNYTREQEGGGGRLRGMSVNTWIIIANVAAHLLANTMLPVLYQVGHLSTERAVQRLEVWRLVTFQFLHDPRNIGHIVMNMFGLYVFGGVVEQALGGKKYLAFYLVCGVFGGVAFLLLNYLGYLIRQPIPGLLVIDLASPLVGASAGVFGILMACAYIAPSMPVQILLIPISFRMRTFAYAYLVIALANLLLGSHDPSSNAGGQAAHVGGAIAGFFFIRNSHLLRDFFDVFEDSRKEPGRRPPRRPARDRSRERVDEILDKAAREGVQSLSDREKQTLRAETERLREQDRG